MIREDIFLFTANSDKNYFFKVKLNVCFIQYKDVISYFAEGK